MEKQYDFFKYMYIREEERYKELLNRGKVFITIITFYLGLLFFNAPDVLSFESTINISSYQKTWYSIPILLFTISFLLNIFALGVYKYEELNDLEELINKGGTELIEEDEFLTRRLADFAIATKRNQIVNDRRATLLLFTSFFMLLGIVSHLLFLLIFFK